MAENPLYRPARALMVARGYRKKARAQLFVKALAPGVRGGLGLTAGTAPGALSLSAQVGVWHDGVRHWVATLLDRDPANQPRTVGRSLSGLLPHWEPWHLVRGEDAHNAATWERLGREFDEYGEPWLTERADPHRLVEALRAWEGGPTSRLSLPVLLWILGDKVGAREALECGRQASVTGPLDEYDAFTQRLLAEIDAQPDCPAA